MFGGKKYIFGLTLTTQTLKLFQNHFHSQPVMFKGYNTIQRSVLTQKFIARNEHYFKKRKKENSQIKPLASASSLFVSENNAVTSRRMIRLNKIFMEKITEILMTTYYASPLMKIGFEITQIKVQYKLSSIHVYWNYSQDIDEEELNKLLLELSSYLRTELNSQHILGRIPPITFVRDLALQNGIEVDKRLKNADFGPDDTTEDPVNDDIEANLSKSAESSNVKHDFPQDIIKIRQDILGVNRENIMKNVLRKCKESKGLHRLKDDSTPPPYTKDDLTPPSYTSYQPENTKLNLPNFPVNSRTHEIKKWATQFKKERKSLSKRQKYAEEKELLCLPEEGDEEDEDSDLDIEIEEDFDENFHEQNYNPDDRF